MIDCWIDPFGIQYTICLAKCETPQMWVYNNIDLLVSWYDLDKELLNKTTLTLNFGLSAISHLLIQKGWSLFLNRGNQGMFLLVDDSFKCTFTSRITDEVPLGTSIVEVNKDEQWKYYV